MAVAGCYTGAPLLRHPKNEGPLIPIGGATTPQVRQGTTCLSAARAMQQRSLAGAVANIVNTADQRCAANLVVRSVHICKDRPDHALQRLHHVPFSSRCAGSFHFAGSVGLFLGCAGLLLGHQK